MHYFGQGVAQDDKEAVKWYKLAADQGDADAQFSLGLSYCLGNGVPQDYVLAHMWTNLAAANGDKKISEARDTIAAEMTPSQIEKAQELAREFQAKNK